MNFLLVIGLLIGIPLIGKLVGDWLIDNWDKVTRIFKSYLSCLGSFIGIIIIFIIAALIGKLLFSSVEKGGSILAGIIFILFIFVLLSGALKK